ncbi:MAG: hypothetical protein P4L83_04445 [Nevskia sp.]|nr:hypothetical protein [Nevskia sp.]
MSASGTGSMGRGLAALRGFAPGRPRLLYLQTSQGVQEPAAAGKRGRCCWVVARSLCRFFQVPLLPEAPIKKQLEALALHIQRASPFEETGSHYDLGPRFIGVWVWDQGAVRSAALGSGIDLGRVPVLPESALVPKADDGVRLLHTLEGFEGQYWSEGCLTASRWWPDAPDERGWLLFQRGASVPPQRTLDGTPAAVRPDWLEQPWTRMRPAGSMQLPQIHSALLAAGFAAAILMIYGYFGAKYLRATYDVHTLNRDIAARSAEIEPLLQDRAAAQEHLSSIRMLQDLDKYPGQVSLMASVAAKLPHNETHLSDWNYDGGQLQFTVTARHPLDSLYFVKAMEQVPGFKKVAVERAGNENSLLIRLSVSPR